MVKMNRANKFREWESCLKENDLKLMRQFK